MLNDGSRKIQKEALERGRSKELVRNIALFIYFCDGDKKLVHINIFWAVTLKSLTNDKKFVNQNAQSL